MEDKDNLITAHITLALGQHALRHSAALVILKDSGYVDVGSATCVRVGERFFLATAGHNFDEVKTDDQVRIVPPNRGVDEPVPFIARHSSNQRGESAVDVAWLEIDPVTAAAEGLAAITVDSFKPFEGHDASRPLSCARASGGKGYPFDS